MSEYERGYEAGLLSDPIPDDASDEWQMGYAAAMEVEFVVLQTEHA